MVVFENGDREEIARIIGEPWSVRTRCAVDQIIAKFERMQERQASSQPLPKARSLAIVR